MKFKIIPLDFKRKEPRYKLLNVDQGISYPFLTYNRAVIELEWIANYYRKEGKEVIEGIDEITVCTS